VVILVGLAYCFVLLLGRCFVCVVVQLDFEITGEPSISILNMLVYIRSSVV
jgi:hypothetical protein